MFTLQRFTEFISFAVTRNIGNTLLETLFHDATNAKIFNKTKIFRSKFILAEKFSSKIFGPKNVGKVENLENFHFLGKIERSEIFITGFQLKIFGFFDFPKFSRKIFSQNKVRAEIFFIENFCIRRVI